MNTLTQDINPIHQDAVQHSLDITIFDGKASTNDSLESALKLLNYLQNYHHRRNFSHLERFGNPDPSSEKMLIELASSYHHFQQLIKYAKNQNIPLKLESSINVKLSPATDA